MKRLVVLLLCAVFVAVGYGEPAVSVPTSVLAHLHKEHPRLLAGSADFEILQRRIAAGGEAGRWFAEIQKDANDMLAAVPSEYVIPDGLRLLATSRRVLDRTFTLGLVFRLTGDRRYAARLWSELDTAAHFKDWNPRHFLDTAEMTAAFAIGYDWLYSEWNADQRAILADAIVRMGLNPSLDVYRRGRSWSTVPHNWNQVCNGGMTLGALAVAESQPDLANEIVSSAIASVPRAMRQFAPDGAWGEGPGYWDYATKYNALMIAALDSALGTDFGLTKIDGFPKAPNFLIQATGPFGRTFNYADANDSGSGGPQILWFASRFDNTGFAAWRIERARRHPEPLDLLWGAAWLDHQPRPAPLPLARYFRGAEVVTMRSAWNDRQATFVGFKAGDNKFNHSHLDLGSFVLDAAGQRWALDLGADDYNLPGYFGASRWSYYRLRTEGHNTLVIAPSAEPDQDPDAAGKIVRFATASGSHFAVADLTAAYAKSARSVQRGVALHGRDVVVEDEIRMQKPAEVWWFLHTSATVNCEGAKATLTKDGARLTAIILSPNGATFSVMPAEPLPGSPHPARQQVKPTPAAHPQKLAVRVENATDLRLTILLTPGDAPVNPPAVVPLSQWK